MYRGLIDSRPVVPLRRGVFMLLSVTWALGVILHNLVCGHRHPFRTAYSDTVIVAVSP